jgi:hypothetical protein
MVKSLLKTGKNIMKPTFKKQNVNINDCNGYKGSFLNSG